MKNENKLSSTRLTEALADNRLRPVDICEKTGISQSALSLYMSGTRIPNRDNAEKISKVLGVSPVWLMGFDVPKYESQGFSSSVGFNIENEIPVDISVPNEINQMAILLTYFSKLSPEKQESVLNLIKTMI